MDLTGQTYGRFTVVREAERRGVARRWLCKCACGTMKTVFHTCLRGGSTRSCGCLRKEIAVRRNAERKAAGDSCTDMIGLVVGRLTVRERADDRNRIRYWACVCECGNHHVVSENSLKMAHTRSCGCLGPDLCAAKTEDLTGKRFGRLIVTGRAPNRNHMVLWYCVCDCGSERTNYSQCLKQGRIRSCGCLSADMTGDRFRKHGAHGSPEYRIWNSMRQRCGNPNNDHYAAYGGRGITVCKRWTKFENFFADMGKRPEGCSIDRIRNSGNYSPSNCRWATRKQQQRNRRTNRIVAFREEHRCLADWCERLQLPYHRTQQRLDLGWSVTRAFTEKVR